MMGTEENKPSISSQVTHEPIERRDVPYIYEQIGSMRTRITTLEENHETLKETIEEVDRKMDDGFEKNKTMLQEILDKLQQKAIAEAELRGEESGKKKFIDYLKERAAWGWGAISAIAGGLITYLTSK